MLNSPLTEVQFEFNLWGLIAVLFLIMVWMVKSVLRLRSSKRKSMAMTDRFMVEDCLRKFLPPDTVIWEVTKNDKFVFRFRFERKPFAMGRHGIVFEITDKGPQITRKSKYITRHLLSTFVHS